MTHSAELLCSCGAALFTSGNPAGRGWGRGEWRGKRPSGGGRAPASLALAAALGWLRRVGPWRSAADSIQMCRGSRVAAARSKWASEARQSGPEQLWSRGRPHWHTETCAREGTVRGAPRVRGRLALMTDPGNVPDTLIYFLVNVLHFKRKGNAVYHLEMLAVYRSLWILQG